MKMSAACSPPIHGAVTTEDRNHPLYPTYSKYRTAMSRQLVRCPAFKDWLHMTLEAEEIDLKNAHPRINEWRRYLRAFHDLHGHHNGTVDFWEWLIKN